MWSRKADLLPGTESTATEKRIRSQLHRTLAIKLGLVAWPAQGVGGRCELGLQAQRAAKDPVQPR
jgi:hypothetical protein